MTSPSFPAALDALANPGPTTETDDAGYELDIVIARLQNCIMAIEQKLGIGVGGPPGSAAVLRQTASGASGWGTITAATIAPGSFPQLIQTSGVLGAPSTLITLPTIDQSYKHLELRVFGRSTAAAAVDSVTMRMNGDATGVYFGQGGQFNGSTTTAYPLGPSATSISVGTIPAASAVAGGFGGLAIAAPGYSGTGSFKSVIATNFLASNNTAGQAYVQFVGGAYFGGTAGITNIQLGLATGQWAAGSIVSLYGWN
jgi:hypothetical protein